MRATEQSFNTDLWPANSLAVWQYAPLEAFADWLARQHVLTAQQFRESSCETYTAMFHTWSAYLAARRMHLLEANPADATAFFEERGRKFEPVSRRRYLQLLDRVYQHLRQLGWPGENPMVRELTKERPLELALPPGLSEPEQQRLVAVLEALTGWKGCRDRGLAGLLLGAGLRANELVTLSADKVRPDFSIQVMPAGVHRPHTTLILPDGPWRAWHEAWVVERQARGIPGVWLYPATLNGRPYSPSGLFRRTVAWFELANVAPAQRGPNILRNTFARNALASPRYELADVQEFLGHSESRATAKHLVSFERAAEGV